MNKGYFKNNEFNKFPENLGSDKDTLHTANVGITLKLALRLIQRSAIFHKLNFCNKLMMTFDFNT